MFSPGAGDDRVVGGRGPNTAWYYYVRKALRVDLGAKRATGQGTDRLESITRVVGGSEADVLIGTAHDEKFVGQWGPDVIRAGSGDDVLQGHHGDDRLFGEGGDDRLEGLYDRDLLDGGPGTDLLDGGPKWDRCRNGEENDRCEAA